MCYGVNMKKNKTKNYEAYMVGSDYCPTCVFFDDLEKCVLKIGTRNGKAYCRNYKDIGGLNND